MNAQDLDKTHPLYQRHIKDWLFQLAAYDGTGALLAIDVLTQNERESEKNYEDRLSEAIGFEYTPAVVDLFACYLFEKQASRELGSLGTDDLWNMFLEDCNLDGDNLDIFLADQQKYASVFGHVGLLVDKAGAQVQTREEEIAAGLHPYVTAYHPPSILDWKWGRDEYGRPVLEYLKLRDEDGRWRMWWVDKWEVWDLIEDEPVLLDSGDNTLGEIPFVWLYNRKDRVRGIGKSDIAGIARIDASIIRNLSQGEEVIKYSAFPMMRKPMRRAGDGVDAAGVTAILEYDPQFANAKPDWLEAKCKEPVDAIMTWIDKKVAEIYRSVNAGGIQATETSNSAKSGVALQYEFQQLNSKLATKASNLDEAELSIIRLWMKWQNMSGFENVTVRRPRKFSVEDLATDLNNALVAKTVVTSSVFEKAISKRIARQCLPGAQPETMEEIDKDIDKGTAIPTINLPGGAD